MTKPEIQQLLIDEITNILKLNGCYEKPLDSGVRPLSDLGGFDSLNAFEVTVSIAHKIGKDFDVDTFGFECGKSNPNMLTIEEIAGQIFKVTQK